MLLDLFIIFKSRIGICTMEGPRLDIIAKESMLDWSARSLLSAGICSFTCWGFLPELGFHNLSTLLFNLPNLFCKFSSWGPRNDSTFLQSYTASISLVYK
jgi:hypothetical protein